MKDKAFETKVVFYGIMLTVSIFITLSLISNL